MVIWKHFNFKIVKDVKFVSVSLRRWLSFRRWSWLEQQRSRRRSRRWLLYWFTGPGSWIAREERFKCEGVRLYWRQKLQISTLYGRQYLSLISQYIFVAYFAKDRVNGDGNCGIFGVFDGHGGCEVALFVKKHFIPTLLKNECFINLDY